MKSTLKVGATYFLFFFFPFNFEIGYKKLQLYLPKQIRINISWSKRGPTNCLVIFLLLPSSKKLINQMSDHLSGQSHNDCDRFLPKFK